MPTVRMLVHRIGTHADGRPWPPFRETIELSDEEAANEVAAGWAEYADGVPKEHKPLAETRTLAEATGGTDPNEETFPKKPEPASDAESESSDDDFDDDFDDDDSELRVVKPKKVSRPNTNDSKSKWVAYAVSLGANENDAWDLTKPRLIEIYGLSWECNPATNGKERSGWLTRRQTARARAVPTVATRPLSLVRLKECSRSG